jgi:MFS family permease
VDAAHRRLLALLALAIFFEGYGRSFLPVTLAYVGRDLGARAAALSWALALVSAGSLGALALGPLADRFGRRRLLLASIGLYALLGAATATAATLAALVAWQAAARAFQEGALFAATVIATEEMPAAYRGRAQGLLGLLNSLGSGLVALLLAAIERVPGGWRALCAVNVAPLALLPFLRRTLPESRRWLRQRRARGVLRGYHGRLAAALAVMALGMSYDVAGFAFTSYLPITVYGWSPEATSLMIIVAGGLGLPGWWAGGRLADRLGRRRVAAGFLIGLSAAEVAFYRGGPQALWPAFALMVFFQGGKMTVLRAWSTELFPTGIRAAAAAWLAAGATVGGMGGLALAAALAARLGDIATVLAALAAAGVLAAAVAWTALPETRGLELEAIAPEG